MPDNSNLAKKLFGFVNIYKSVGMTSHDVVAKVRKFTGVKQVGHTGTLDPFAEGVLPVCIGKATRLIEFLADDKEYLATVQFGKSTDTYDKDGSVIFSSDKKVSEDDLKEALKFFEGEISQVPPIYSAIKVNGKKLYEYARSGKEVEIQPRRVVIENIELKSFDKELQQAQILIKCSKGTYIRSIANDLGENLGCGAHLIRLIRTQAGKFRVENSVKLEDVQIPKNLINPIDMMDYEKIHVGDEDIEYIRNGRPLKNKNIEHGCIILLVYNDNAFCAVGVADENVIKLKKVFL